MKRPNANTVLWVSVMVFGVSSTLLLIHYTPSLIEYRIGGSEIDAKQGVYGDQYGMANAIISGFAFTGLLVAILLQRADLKHQMRELNESQSLVQQQIFEGTLFQMLSLRERIVSEVVPHPDHQTRPANPLIGRNAIAEYVSALVGSLKKDLDSLKIDEIRTFALRHSEIAASYNARYIDYGSTMLSHYFRLTYNIAKYINDSKAIKNEQRTDYFRIFRSQLSDDELLLIFYNCVSTYGYEKFMPLADKYNLFDNLSTHRLAMRYDREFSRSSFHDDYKNPNHPYYDEANLKYFYRDELDLAESYRALCDKCGIAGLEVDLISLWPR